MPKKFTTVAATATLALGLAGAPALAEEMIDEVSDDASMEEVDAPTLKELREAARAARKEARDLAKADAEDGEEEDAAEADAEESESDEDKANAEEALQAALDRLSEEGVGGNGVAADVLTALLAGESPAGIGAEHGAEMAAAAAERREERAAERAEAGKGKPENPGRPEGRGNGRP